MERNYVIMAVERKGVVPGAAMFWGKHTADTQRRNPKGYTCQIRKCERFTREELEDWREGCEEDFPFFDEVGSNKLFQHDNVLITLDQLEELGFKEYVVMRR